ncbi:MAG: hypothetical protein IPO72_02965 [Saprospiraceae bacterium]|nr:hypothetical protein [Candidatus Vicinibacter affinis]
MRVSTILLLASWLSLQVCWAQSLTIKYSKVGLRALIPVEFKNASGVDGSWIGVYRESDPDGNYISYQYINNLTSGELTFPGFKSSGVYNFRLYRDGGYNKIATSASFLVVEGMVIDNSFGDNGIFKWDASGAKLANGAKAVRLTKDGQLIIAGDVKNGKVSTNGAETVDFTVVKLGVDGLLDPSFGMNGKVVISIKSSFYQVFPTSLKAMALQVDGKIILGGDFIVTYSDNSLGYEIGLVRLNSNGQMDQTFGDKGLVIQSFRHDGETPSQLADELKCLEVTSDNKILIGGGSISSATFSPGRPAIRRFLNSGMYDSSFGAVGLITPLDSITWRGYIESIIPPTSSGDGSFLAIGTARAQFGANHQLLYRFDKNGAYVKSFGNGKPVVEKRPGFHNETYSKRILNFPDGEVLMYGGSDIFAPWLIKRSATSGSNISDFGNLGLVICDPAELEVPGGIFIDNDRISIAYTGNGRQLAMSRYNLKGELDIVFGHPYFEFTDQSGTFIEYNVLDVIKQNRDRYVMVGSARHYNPPHFETFAIAFKDNPAVFSDIDGVEKIRESKLFQNYPNPFNSHTTIPFFLDKSSRVTIEIYDFNGNNLGVLFEGELTEGDHEIEVPSSFFTGKNLTGKYLYTLMIKHISGIIITSKILNLK